MADGEVYIHETAADLLAWVEPALLAREAENCLVLGFARQALTQVPPPVAGAEAAASDLAAAAAAAGNAAAAAAAGNAAAAAAAGNAAAAAAAGNAAAAAATASPATAPGAPLLISVCWGDGPPQGGIGAAVRLGRRNMALSRMPQKVLATLVAAVRSRDPALTGVIGPASTAEGFATAWAEANGLDASRALNVTMAQRVFQLERVIPPPAWPAGVFRPATPADVPALAAMVRAFSEEALGDAGDSDYLKHSAAAVADGRYFVWAVDGMPVTMAATSGPTPTGIRLTTVYTPREWRRRGLASACVAALSQRLLDGGSRRCFLFTDLANPTSNHIYQEIGYRPVADFKTIKL